MSDKITTAERARLVALALVNDGLIEYRQLEGMAQFFHIVMADREREIQQAITMFNQLRETSLLNQRQAMDIIKDQRAAYVRDTEVLQRMCREARARVLELEARIRESGIGNQE